MASIDPQNAKKIKPPPNPFFWPQVIEWSAIIGAIMILAGGGFFFVYPMFQKFQTLPKVLENEKNAYDEKLKEYQATSEKLELLIFRHKHFFHSQEPWVMF